MIAAKDDNILFSKLNFSCGMRAVTQNDHPDFRLDFLILVQFPRDSSEAINLFFYFFFSNHLK